MIEVNLRPGGKKRPASRGISLPEMPSIEGLPTDPWILSAVAVVVVGLGAMGWLWKTTGDRHGELETQVEEAVADSARYADLIEAMNRLRARRDSIAQRVEIIQEIDAGRYIWPHVMDEVSGALPEYTWIIGLTQLASGDEPRFRINGKTGNNLALTRFMRNLEASTFIRDVTLISTQQIQEGGRILNQFGLEAAYETPPMDQVETVPLFEGGSGPPSPGEATGDGAPDR